MPFAAFVVIVCIEIMLIMTIYADKQDNEHEQIETLLWDDSDK